MCASLNEGVDQFMIKNVKILNFDISSNFEWCYGHIKGDFGRFQVVDGAAFLSTKGVILIHPLK